MPRVVMVLTNPTLKVADDQASLAAGTAYECQVTSAVISTNVTMNTIPATGCAGASQSPGAPGYQLDLAWLQDWTAAGGGLSGWAWENRLTKKWIELVPDKNAAPTVTAEGEVWIVPGQFGGTFGDGSAAPATATWAFVNDPDITPAVVAAAAEAPETVDA
jgi:hypothetical protein